jgi:hypothetical protein
MKEIDRSLGQRFYMGATGRSWVSLYDFLGLILSIVVHPLHSPKLLSKAKRKFHAKEERESVTGQILCGSQTQTAHYSASSETVVSPYGDANTCSH